MQTHALRIDLHRGGKVRVLDIQADRALVGSGGHCEVRLGPDEAAVEQLLLEARDEEVFLKVLSLDPPCRLNGAPILEGRLSPDSMLELGSVALCVRLAALNQTAGSEKKKSAEMPTALRAVALLAIGVGLYFVLQDAPDAPSALNAAATPPALFAHPAVECPQSDADSARSLADQLHADAENKRERSPFYPRDGLLAVPLYARAAACYTRAQLTREAQESERAAQTLEQRMVDEFHVRRVRIERFISLEKYAAVGREARLALEFLQDKSVPYAQWLSAVAREADLRTSAKGGK
jgi:hypothetical protein